MAISKPILDLNALELLDQEDLLKLVKGMMSGGVALSFHGKRTATEISKRVRPRVTRRLPDLSVGTAEEQSRNMIIEGENLQAMVTLYKFRGQIDLIVTDPPYNTGQQFRYNDRWDDDPNDPDLGTLVTMEDGSRHTKWIRAILPRLQMMKSMLKPQGVIAICIDDNELFHLGVMMDEVFGEENRIGVINWEKTYSAKNDSRHLSTATEYVLVYAKQKDQASTRLLDRTKQMDARYKSRDGDPKPWYGGDLGGGLHRKPEDFGIQSPFTGEMHYPPSRSRWRMAKAQIKRALESWDSDYVSLQEPSATLPSLVLKGTVLRDGKVHTPSAVLERARTKALAVRDHKVWPVVYFLKKGEGRPRQKRYLENVKKGIVPTTFWADDDLEENGVEQEEPFELGPQSWSHEQSGNTDTAKKELDRILGPTHGFQTIKPLKLMSKIIRIWCPPNGVILDPYAGSGTTGQATLQLNHESRSSRRFILIEQGRPENGDKYARSLTRERLKRAITGERPNKAGKLIKSAEPLGGGFEFRMLTTQIDAKTVLSMRKDELIDVVITSYWDSGARNAPTLVRLDDTNFKFLVGKNQKDEGYFLIWNGGNAVGQLDVDNYNIVLQEARKAGLKSPYHVYARYEVYQSQNVIFYKIPDKILAHLGLNESSDRFNEDE
jgi:adenine-specific DNA-methyltransferase